MVVGILGAGGMGRCVIEHLRQCPEVTVVVAYDPDPTQLKQFEGDAFVRVTGRLEEILSDVSLTLVFITAPNHAHKTLTIAALNAGKAVMCEKPMANQYEDALAMVEAAEHNNGFLQIGFELRYSRLYLQVKEWIEADLLGEIINSNCTYLASAWPKGEWRNTNAGGGSMFGEKLSHYVDLPRWWINSPVLDIYAACAPNVIPYLEIHDNYHATYRFESGAISHISFLMGPASTFRGDPLQNVVSQQTGDGHALRYLVVGTKGAAEADVFNRTIKRWEFGDSPDYFTSTLTETLSWNASEDHAYFHNTFDQTKDIVRRVKQGLPPSIAPRDALETTRLCFAADESVESGAVIAVTE